jgi:hypothetical protein
VYTGGRGGGREGWHLLIHINDYMHNGGPGRSVGIATDYGLDGPEIESRWGEIFRTCPDRPWGPPSLLHNEYRIFPGVKCGRCVTLTNHPLLVPSPWESRAIPLPTLWATPGL